MAFVYVPNGIDMRHWNPAYEGTLAELPQTLAPLAPLKDDILLLGNLTHNTGRALLDGAGDHGRCCGSYLTGVQVKKTVTDIKASVSCDQLVANQIGKQTRFPSLEVGLEDARQAGDCDSGYSCAYTNNLAWRSETQPLPPILDPRGLFERLFGDGAELTPEASARRTLHRRSILDFVTDDTQSLRGALGPTDQRKLDEYLGSIRDIEEQYRAPSVRAPIDPHMDKPYGVPSDFAEHFRLMTDMITVAFQADLTRVVTFLVTREGTSRAYREIGIADGHHPLTHHRNQVELMDKVAQINRYHVEQFAKWVAKLKASQEDERIDPRQLDDRLRCGPRRWQRAHAPRPADAHRWPRREVHQDRAPRGVSPRNADVQPVPDDDGSHGRAMDYFGDATGHLNGLDLA